MRKKLMICLIMIIFMLGQILAKDEFTAGQLKPSSDIIPDPIPLNGNYQMAPRIATMIDKYGHGIDGPMTSKVNNPFYGYSGYTHMIQANFGNYQAEKIYSSTIFYFPLQEFIINKAQMINGYTLTAENGSTLVIDIYFNYVSDNATAIVCAFTIKGQRSGHPIVTYIDTTVALIKYQEYVLLEINYEASTFYNLQNRYATSISVIQLTEGNEVLSSFYYGLELAFGAPRHWFSYVYTKLKSFTGNDFINRMRYNEMRYSSDFNNGHNHNLWNFYLEKRLMGRIHFEPEQGFHEVDNLPYWEYLTTELGSFNELINHSTQYNYSVIVNETYTENNTRYVVLAFNYSKSEVVWTTGKYRYNPETIKAEDWGNWGVNNWARNLIVTLLNALILAFNFIFFLILIALNYLLWIPLCYIILVVNNYVLFYVSWGLSWVIFAGILVFLWLWDKVIYPILQLLWFYVLIPAWNWLMDNVFIPVWEWLKTYFRMLITWLQNDGLKYLINLFLTITAFVLAVILWVLSFGRLDFMTLWSSLSEMLIAINTFIYDTLNMFLLNILFFMRYSLIYLIMVGLIYLKYVYCKAKGYVVRAQRLQSMINVYKLPLVLTVRVFQYIVGFLQGGSPTDGADK